MKVNDRSSVTKRLSTQQNFMHTNKPKNKTSPWEFVVVYGPPATGKTINAKALQDHYGCHTAIIDVGRQLFTADTINYYARPRTSGRILVLDNSKELRDPFDRRRKLTNAQFVSVEEAAKALGNKWISPKESGK
jgi:AAA+ superfamily predicted ATPase